MKGKSGSIQMLRGAMSTPSGDKIPMKVRMRLVRGSQAYTHIGEIDIPSDWLGEFEEDIRGFVFRSEDGECFTQFQILEEAGDAEDAPQRHGRIILMRDISEDEAVIAPEAIPAKAPHLQLVGV